MCRVVFTRSLQQSIPIIAEFLYKVMYFKRNVKVVRPVKYYSSLVSIRFPAHCSTSPRPRDAALPAESPAARPLTESRHWVGYSRTQQPPSARHSIHGTVRPRAHTGAAVSPGHTPTEGARGAPQLAPGGQGVHL